MLLNGRRIVSFMGSSWNLVADSVGGELEFSAVEEDAGAVVVEDAEAAGGRFERLDFAVEAFADGVGDRLPEVAQQVRQVTLEHLGFGDNRWQLAAYGPAIPIAEEGEGARGIDVLPKAAKVFLDGPGPAGFQSLILQGGQLALSLVG